MRGTHPIPGEVDTTLERFLGQVAPSSHLAVDVGNQPVEVEHERKVKVTIVMADLIRMLKP